MTYTFNDALVTSKWNELKNVEIGRAFIKRESIDKIVNILQLASCKNSEEVRAIRNSVVKMMDFYNEWMDDFDNGKSEEPDWDAVFKEQTLVSGVTAAIDFFMSNKFNTL